MHGRGCRPAQPLPVLPGHEPDPPWFVPAEPRVRTPRIRPVTQPWRVRLVWLGPAPPSTKRRQDAPVPVDPCIDPEYVPTSREWAERRACTLEKLADARRQCIPAARTVVKRRTSECIRIGVAKAATMSLCMMAHVRGRTIERHMSLRLPRLPACNGYWANRCAHSVARP